MYEIDLFKKFPLDVQHETLMKLLKKAKDTEWGLKYDFKSIKTIQDYQNRFPLQDYDSFKPYIKRLQKGEQNILWSSDIKWFAKSSGTTSDKSKFIPVSKEALEDCHYRGGKDIIALYTSNFPESKILKGKGLALGGSQQLNEYDTDAYYGDVSAIIIQNLPFWAQFIRTPDISISLMDEWEEKIQQIARATIQDNVTNLSGVPSWTLVLLNYILEHSKKSNIMEVWNDLELFVHGGVNFAPYKDQFKKIIPSDQMNYLETYNASEGFFSIQDDLQTDEMLLMLDYGIFYEFIPVENIDDEYPKTLVIDEVELNKNYAIVISTNAGLWRYMIGDTVIFTSKFPFKIKVSGRTKHFINAFGEEVIIDNAERALEIACKKTNSTISEYTAAPIYMNNNQKGSHEWLIEFDIKPANIDYFTDMLDNALKSLNSDYEAKRYKNLTLELPIVRNIEKGTFYNWLKSKGKVGGQNKVPRLANHRNYVNEINKFCNLK
jgi:hypothetical protein